MSDDGTSTVPTPWRSWGVHMLAGAFIGFGILGLYITVYWLLRWLPAGLVLGLFCGWALVGFLRDGLNIHGISFRGRS